MTTKITKRGNTWTATNGTITVTTKTIDAGMRVPAFTLSMDLLSLFPFLSHKIKDFILENHRTFASHSRRYKHIGVCWSSTTRRAPNDGYCGFTMGNKKWGFCVRDRLHRVSYIIFKKKDIDGIGTHICNAPSCFNPDHIIDGSFKSNSIEAAATADNLHPGAVFQDSWKMTAFQVLWCRDVFRKGCYSAKFLARAFNMDESSMSNILTSNTYGEICQEIIDEFNKLLDVVPARSFTPEEDLILLSSLSLSITDEDLAKALRRSPNSITTRRHRISERKNHYWTAKEDKAILKASKVHGGIQKQADKMGFSARDVYSRRHYLKKTKKK